LKPIPQVLWKCQLQSAAHQLESYNLEVEELWRSSFNSLTDGWGNRLRRVKSDRNGVGSLRESKGMGSHDSSSSLCETFALTMEPFGKVGEIHF
jgi:hypothetical protein